MTLPATSRSAGPYTGNGVQTAFPFSFKIIATTDVKVTQADVTGAETVLSSGYTVTMNSDQNATPGGTVTLSTALPTNYKISLTGNLPYDQTLSLPGGGNFNPTALETDLDRTVMQIQQLREAISRAVQVSVTSGTDPAALIASVTAAASSAAASAAAATATLNTFKGQYYGSLASDPALDPLGNPVTAGDMYFNTGSNTMRVYGTSWADVAAGVSVPYQLLSGTGAQTVFTLNSAPGALGNLQVCTGGVNQVPGADYTLSNTTLTFTTAPVTGTNNIFCRWITTQALTVPADQSVTAAKLDPALAATIGTKAGGTIFENKRVLTSNYTLTAGNSGHAVGPYSINSGVTLTIPSGERFVIL